MANGRSGPRILIVDDNDGLVATLSLLLEREGFDVASAGTCREGMELAESYRPEVILLDWILPDGEGPNVLGKLKDICGASCIMVTAQDTPQHCVLALEAGCDDFVSKPIRPGELLLRLNRVLMSRNSEVGGREPAGDQ